MICPYCTYVDNNIKIPEVSGIGVETFFVDCPNCGKDIWIITGYTEKEVSKEHTMIVGERRGTELMKTFIKNTKDIEFIRKTSDKSVIDFEVFDLRLNLIGYLEIVERNCTINAYRDTMFNKSKIQKGRELQEENNLPVIILIKFVDCWAYHKVSDTFKYRVGMDPSYPQYRKLQKYDDSQVTTFIPVEGLKVLKFRDLCFDGKRKSKINIIVN